MGEQRPSCLVLAPMHPAPTGNGLAMRIDALVRAVGLTHDVHLVVLLLAGAAPASISASGASSVRTVPLSEPIAPEDATALLTRPGWSERLSALESPSQRLALAMPAFGASLVRDAIGRRVAGVLACRLGMAPLGLAVAEALGVPLLIDADDADVPYFVERGEHQTAEAWDQVGQVVLPPAALVTTATAEAGAWLATRYGIADRIATISNSVDLPDGAATGPQGPGEGRLLFVGNLTYPPNEEGIVWFVREVLPRLGARFSLDAVGAPSQAVTRLAGPRVRVRGYVEDLRTFYEQADVVVAPIWTGSGSRIKLLEAFAHGRPVVATSKALDGLAVVPDVHARVADTAADFAAACVEVATSDGGGAMAQRARQLVRDQYDRARVVAEASGLISRAMTTTGDVHPTARDDLDVNEVPDGLVIYDGVNDQVHYLNMTASAVFALCDGQRDAAALAQELQSVFDLPEPPTDATEECLATLRAQGLVV